MDHQWNLVQMIIWILETVKILFGDKRFYNRILEKRNRVDATEAYVTVYDGTSNNHFGLVLQQLDMMVSGIIMDLDPLRIYKVVLQQQINGIIFVQREMLMQELLLL